MRTFNAYLTGIMGSFMALLVLCANAIPVEAAGPKPVNLGPAGDFVLLSKTGVTTTGTTFIVGNVGVSPAAATYNTGFGLILDATKAFSGSSG